MIKNIIILLFLLITFANGSLFNRNDSFSLFCWYQDSNDSLLYGCRTYVVFQDNIKCKLGLFDYQWWFVLFPDMYIDCTVKISNKPEKVIRCSDHFNDNQWISGIQHDTDLIQFYFPISEYYGQYDYFTVDVNDSFDLEFYGAGDSIMVGTFVHKEPDERGAVNIIARNAFIVEITNNNLLMIKSIRCNGRYKEIISAYLNYDLETFKKDQNWYGITFIENKQIINYLRIMKE